MTCNATSGDTFPLGDTIVDCSATDTAGNTGHSLFTVTVEDTTAPEVAAHADMRAGDRAFGRSRQLHPADGHRPGGRRPR